MFQLSRRITSHYLKLLRRPHLNDLAYRVVECMCRRFYNVSMSAPASLLRISHLRRLDKFYKIPIDSKAKRGVVI